MQLGAAILAGGRNARMGGRNKAFLRVDDRPLLHITLETLWELFDDIILVTNNPDDFRPYRNDCRIVTDRIAPIGPLGGILTALTETSADGVFIVACDMPFIDADLIKILLEHFQRQDCDVILPRVGSVIQPLHAVYARSLEQPLDRYLHSCTNHAIRNFLNEVNARYLDLEDSRYTRHIFHNVNTPEDLRQILALHTIARAWPEPRFGVFDINKVNRRR